VVVVLVMPALAMVTDLVVVLVVVVHMDQELQLEGQVIRQQ
jgi:hypothetical protein